MRKILYFDYLAEFIKNLQNISLSELIKNPKQTSVLSVDMTNGFCRSGNLASKRVAALIPSIVQLLEKCWELGIRDIALLHDVHSRGAKEFEAFAQHCIRGTQEAQAVDEIRSLHFYPEMNIFEKNSLNPAIRTDFDVWLEKNRQLSTFIVVGNCTDLCIYQTAMHLRMTGNAYDLNWKVIIPENCVNTYDIPVDKATELNIQPHPGDLLHQLFLHHMALNAIEVYRSIE